MSVFDFRTHIEHEPNPAGDRLNVRISGKYLSYKPF